MFYLRFFSSFCILFMLVFVNFVFEAVWVNQGFLNAWQVVFFIFTGIFVNINLLNEYRIQNFMNSPDHRWARAKEIHKKFENRFPVDSTALIINFEYTELEWLMINDLFVGERVAFLKNRIALFYFGGKQDGVRMKKMLLETYSDRKSVV